ncbi:hypothetical protein FJ366_03785 [Candidatus Dependentiae bacterium]|nr:hypothetical protein [Candidatus Dependentiae bacterium]
MIKLIAKFITTTPADLIRKYLLGLTLFLTLLLGFSFWYITTTSRNLARNIRIARELTGKADLLISEYNAVIQEEDNLAETLTKKKDFTGLKSYFERFCQATKMTPEPGWSDTAEIKEINGNDRFEEESLHAQIKNIKMKDIVQYIDAIEKDELLTLKELSIEKNDKTLAIKLTVAAKRFKRTIEE